MILFWPSRLWPFHFIFPSLLQFSWPLHEILIWNSNLFIKVGSSCLLFPWPLGHGVLIWNSKLFLKVGSYPRVPAMTISVCTIGVYRVQSVSGLWKPVGILVGWKEMEKSFNSGVESLTVRWIGRNDGRRRRRGRKSYREYDRKITGRLSGDYELADGDDVRKVRETRRLPHAMIQVNRESDGEEEVILKCRGRGGPGRGREGSVRLLGSAGCLACRRSGAWRGRW